MCSSLVNNFVMRQQTISPRINRLLQLTNTRKISDLFSRLPSRSRDEADQSVSLLPFQSPFSRLVIIRLSATTGYNKRRAVATSGAVKRIDWSRVCIIFIMIIHSPPLEPVSHHLSVGLSSQVGQSACRSSSHDR